MSKTKKKSTTKQKAKKPTTKKAKKPTTKKKATKKKKSAKPKPKSNKDQVYLAWKDGEEDIETLHKKVKKAVKEKTIKGWLSRWSRGKGLPRIAK